MAEGIVESAPAVAMELILDRLLDDSPGGYGSGESSVDVGHLDRERARHPAASLRPDDVVLGMFVGEHQLGGTDHELAVADAAVVAHQPVQLDRAERLGVEGQRSGCVADDEVQP